MGPPALLPIRRKVCCGLLSIAFAGFQPANFGSSGKHINYYIRKATRAIVLMMGEVCTSETSVNFYHSKWCNTPEDRLLHTHRC
jgi:hypothetical protein